MEKENDKKGENKKKQNGNPKMYPSDSSYYTRIFLFSELKEGTEKWDVSTPGLTISRWFRRLHKTLITWQYTRYFYRITGYNKELKIGNTYIMLPRFTLITRAKLQNQEIWYKLHNFHLAEAKSQKWFNKTRLKMNWNFRKSKGVELMLQM